jgi:CubicO group peptidase (beta-lactamase class C family)
MAKMIHEVLEEARKKRSKADKIEVLRSNESWALKDILRGTFDETIQWTIPTGEPPYTPNQPNSAPGNLLRENTKFAYFVKGGKGDKMMKAKREQIFIGVLEAIDPNDAKLVVGMINKKMPVSGITKNMVIEAFPGLIRK